MLDYDLVSVARRALEDDENAIQHRYDLRDSIVIGGYRYWGNARIAMRLKSEDADTKDFPVPPYTTLRWPLDTDDMEPWPQEPDKIFYVQSQKRYFDNEFHRGQLEEVCFSVDGLLIDPKYFEIIARLKNAKYCIVNEMFVIRSAGGVEALVNSMTDVDMADYLIAVPARP